MRRIALLVTVVALLGACRDYKSYPRLSDQEGLMPADAWAQYDPEAAQKIAIGRKFAEAYTGDTPEARLKQTETAIAYAKTLPGVAEIKADTLGFWLSVEFKSGWRIAVSPIADGVKAEDTKGLPTS